MLGRGAGTSSHTLVATGPQEQAAAGQEVQADLHGGPEADRGVGRGIRAHLRFCAEKCSSSSSSGTEARTRTPKILGAAAQVALCAPYAAPPEGALLVRGERPGAPRCPQGPDPELSAQGRGR